MRITKESVQMKNRGVNRREMMREHYRWQVPARAGINFRARVRLGLPRPKVWRLFEYERFHQHNAENKGYRAFSWRLAEVGE